MPPGLLRQDAIAFLQYLCLKICDSNETFTSTFNNSKDLDFNNLYRNSPSTSSFPTNTESTSEVKQKDALLYIIVVLMFYSLGMIIMLIGYLKREREELEEERHLHDFLKTPPPTVWTHRGCSSGKLALQAFNAASFITQPNTSEGKVTFV